MRSKNCVQRRTFVKTGLAVAAAPAIVPRHVLGGPTAPSNRITLGGVGVGGVGHGQVKGLAKAGFQVEALCDVDDLHAKKTYDKFPQARRYRDFREMLAKEGDKIDAVYCGTPDHTHAFVTLAALRAKKHVCCVKPLTRSIEECYLVAEEARKAGVATQVTASPCTSDAACRTREIVASGILGDIVETYAWTRRPVWPQGMPAYPSFTTPVPGTLDWDLWIGSAEKRPYADKWPDDNPIPKMCPEAWKGAAVYHPFNHRGWYDFGAGALGDMGCHWANTIYKALDLDHPSMISASCTRRSDVAFPLASVVTFDYPKRGNFPELRFTEGGRDVRGHEGENAHLHGEAERDAHPRPEARRAGEDDSRHSAAPRPDLGRVDDGVQGRREGRLRLLLGEAHHRVRAPRQPRRAHGRAGRLRPEDDARHEQSGRRRPPAPQVLQRLEPVGRPSAAELSSRGRQ